MSGKFLQFYIKVYNDPQQTNSRDNSLQTSQETIKDLKALQVSIEVEIVKVKAHIGIAGN